MAPEIYVPYVDLTRPREPRSFFVGSAKIGFGILMTAISVTVLAWSVGFAQHGLETAAAHHQVVSVDLVRK